MGDGQKGDLRVDFDRRVKLTFLGSKVATDAGLLAYRELDEVLGLTGMAEALLCDSRVGGNKQHQLAPLLRQSIYSRRAVLAYEDPRVKLLMTMPGVSVIVAQAMVAAFGDIERFASADKAASYLGLVPSTKQSAKSCHHGPITKRSNSNARWMLAPAAQHMHRQAGPLGHFFRRHASADGEGEGDWSPGTGWMQEARIIGGRARSGRINDLLIPHRPAANDLSDQPGLYAGHDTWLSQPRNRDQQKVLLRSFPDQPTHRKAEACWQRESSTFQ